MAEPLFPCPSDWELVNLTPDAKGPYVQHVDSGGTPSTTKPENWDGEIAWLTPKEITRNGLSIYVSATERNITRLGLQSSGAKLLPPNTVMLTKRAPVGAVAISAIPMSTNQGFLNFRCGSGLRPLFLAHWCRANVSYLQQVANGSTYRELYMSDLFEFKIGVPPLEIQDAILSIINALQYVSLLGPPLEQSVILPEDMMLLQEQGRKLDAIQKSLITHLLAGRLDVTRVAASLKSGENV